MAFSEKYTTAEKIAVDKLLPKELQTKEETKTVLTNDGFAFAEAVNLMNLNLANVMRSFAK